MIELKEYQKKAVRRLKEEIVDMLANHTMRQKIVFKAPTGSGKTVMASALLDDLKSELETKFMECAYIWIAPNKLHIQSYMSFRNFFSETRSLRPVMFDDADVTEGLRPGEVLFLNWESINKENAVIIRDNEQNRTLRQLTRRTKEKGLPILVVIDEEHMFAGKNAKKSEMVLKIIDPKIELRVSATPQTGGCTTVEVPRDKVIAEEMIKKGIELNPQVTGSFSMDLTMNIQLLEQALERRNNLARAYHEHNINPLLLIQLPNDSKDTLDTEEKSLVQEIEQYLGTKHNITADNGKLAVWLSDRKDNVAGLEKSDNLAEVLLFKQAIALGWDCPRASVLLIFRDIKSKTFTAQTVGRILRMPQQQHYTNDALNYGYVFTNLSSDMIEIVAQDMTYISTVYARKRDGINRVELNAVYQNRRKTPHVLLSPFKGIFKQTVSEEWNLPQTELFGADMGWEDLQPEETDRDDYSFSENRRKANQHGIKTDVTKIMVKIPKDLKLTGDTGRIDVADQARFAKTQGELLVSFNQFCRKNVGDYEPGQSAEMIRSAIYEFFEEYLGIDQNDAIKVVLYHLNRPKFESYLAKAEANYARDYEKRERERNPKEYVQFHWELPDTRMYNSEVSHNCDDIFRHALMPFFESNQASDPERRFSRLLDQSNETVEWWYKNADSGHMHFAVPYTDIEGEPRCFYVDFVIRLKNGTVCLFDTKSKESDANAPMKHNALLDYIKHENELNHKRLMGGVIIEKNDNWYYSPLKIENTSDLRNWDALDFHTINVQS